MENLGLYDDDQGRDPDEMDDGEESSPDRANARAAMDQMEAQ